MNTIYKLCLDLQEAVSPILLPIPQRDTARCLQIRLTHGGIPYPIPEDAFAVLTAKAPSGSSLPWLPCERTRDSLLCPIPGSHTAQPGLLRCQLRLYHAADESLLLTAPEFSLEITRQVCDADDDQAVAPDPNALDTLVSNTLAAADAANAAAAALAADVENGRFQGEKGEKGDTPVRGVDYFTPEDLLGIKADILTQMDFAMVTESAYTVSGMLCLPDTTRSPFLYLLLAGTADSPDTAQLELRGKNFFDRGKIRSALLGEGSDIHITGGGFHYDLYTGETGVSHAVAAEKLPLLPVLPAGTYTLSYRRISDGGYLRVEKVADDGTVTLLNSADDPVFTLDAPSRITLRRSINTLMSVEQVQIEPGKAATAYEDFCPVRSYTLPVGTEAAQLPMANYPTTVLTTTPGLMLTLRYYADTKNYITKKLSQ